MNHNIIFKILDKCDIRDMSTLALTNSYVYSILTRVLVDTNSVLFKKKKTRCNIKIGNRLSKIEKCVKYGYIDLIKLFLKENMPYDNEWLMQISTEYNRRDLIDLAIKNGAHLWNNGLRKAISAGHQDLIEFFIEKGADIVDIYFFFRQETNGISYLKKQMRICGIPFLFL